LTNRRIASISHSDTAFGKQGDLGAKTILQKRVGGLLFYGLVILLAFCVYLIFAPFFVPLAWAAVLVVVSYPAYEWLEQRMHPNTAAFVSTLGVTLILIVPAVLVMIAFVRQGVEAVQSIQFSIAAGHYTWLSGEWNRLQDRFPDLGGDDVTTTLHRYTEQAAGFVAAKLGTILKNTAVFFFHLAVTILVMFYLYRDGEAIVERLRQVLPFDSDHGDRMLGDARELIFASVTSSLAAAVVHALLGGFAFAVTGIKAPLFWGVMMGFFSFIPVAGSALVWVPAAVSLMVGGHLGRGVFLVIFCALIVGLVDNVMRPWLISGRAELGGLLVFISVLGGIDVFGLLGVVLGPIIVATTAGLLELYAPPGSDGNNRAGPRAKRKKAVLE
jgi:predicted PurR-regulated permease PerM